MAINVAGLYAYPIKGCAPVELEEAQFSDRGIAYDREWMLVGPRNRFLTQRVHPELALVQTSLANGMLSVTAPGQENLEIPLDAAPADGEEVPVEVFKKPGSGIDEGPAAAEYFSDFLHRPARLLRIFKDRRVKPECRVEGASENIGFADGFPILLTSVSSLAVLNTHINPPVPMDRFRPNIVVDGSDLAPYDEDYWRELRIGAMRFFVVRACARCPVPNVDQQTGILPKPAGRSVSAALRGTRRGIDPVNDSEGEFFGQNMVHVPLDEGTIRIGDPVHIVRRADEPNFQPLTSVSSSSRL